MLTMDDIVREGHPALRKPAEEVPVPLSEEDRQTLEDMMQFLRNSQDPETAETYGLRPGVGLAAPQINVSKNMFVVRFAEEDEEPIEMTFVNPKIISHSAETTHLPDGEGCLSVDRSVEGTVPRYSRVKVEATDENGHSFTIRLRGFFAIVFQHEFDHLNGIMFYDRIDGDDPYKEDVPPALKVIRSQDDTPLSF
ncbi:peptide deformylase [Salisediminibacterium selenitireducens]|uniref:Peptide deformylase n=1 Tax=Bacillus selenitireducens (strain ATCC 700615 / DSM 15326 / MLS10) TaxID=439292 RepID=D6XTH3_BACIE|nr:peptide deformylase [Salisediminibacterium selenitireducens]ADH99109.1 peptide deformylase [[Bacillus] selenitireducens MLS10]